MQQDLKQCQEKYEYFPIYMREQECDFNPTMSKNQESTTPYIGLSHDQIWKAIDRLASTFGYSASGLAKQAGLDPTSFNKSKRVSADGKPRWPSTESIARILSATGASMSDFLSYLDPDTEQQERQNHGIPMIGFAQAGSDGFFDEDGYPQGDAWDHIVFPTLAEKEQETYALQVSGNSMEPLYRDGDVLVVCPSTSIRKGDRVIVKTSSGEVLAKELEHLSETSAKLKSLNEAYDLRQISIDDISWMARILWVSQ